MLFLGESTHTSIETCEFVWSDSEIDESSLNVAINENGSFFMEFTELEESLTITMKQSVVRTMTTKDTVTIQYIVEESE